MSYLQLIGAIVGLIAFIPLIADISKDKNNETNQNFATWILWAILDGIAAVTTIFQSGNFWLPLGYSFGGFAITILLIYRKRISWTKFESLIAVLVTICLSIWWYVGDKAGTLASTLAVMIASIPQLIDIAKNPSSTPRLVYFLFGLGGFLSFIGGKSWTIEERLYPANVIIVCFTALWLSTRKTEKIQTSAL
jgi:hypothetical protein